MGTFHDTSDPLHGITVVARRGGAVYVGRCHERDRDTILLLGVDIHEENEDGTGDDGRTNAEFIERAAKFGVWNTHERVALPAGEVEELTPLNEFYRGPGRQGGLSPLAAGSSDSPAAQPAPVAVQEASPAPDSGDSPVNITASARDEIRRLLQEEQNHGQALRLGVAGGGCSGFVYKVEFDARRDGDLVVPEDGFDVLLDRKSTIYLRGVTLDYQKGLSGKGFTFQNPNASNTCGCGESFSV